MNTTRLFKPVRIGDIEVKHRVGMPSLTRCRATESGVPTPLMKDYYSQRACVPGTLLLAEGTLVSGTYGGFPHGPGIYNEEQVQAWRDITDEVHRQGSFIYCQLFSMGRAASPEIAAKAGVPIVAPSALAKEDGATVPREMTVEEIEQEVRDWAIAAKNAIRAGFDGVEVHVANGYLLDQFIQDVSNHREDSYGGSIEKRCRLIDEVLEAVTGAIGAARVGMRISPWSTFQGMGMKDPVPQFRALINHAQQFGLAYMHAVEARMSGAMDNDRTENIDFVYDAWKGPLLIAGGYTLPEAQRLVDQTHPDRDIVVMFGRYFISNPDLVFRFVNGLAVSAYDRSTFYTAGSPVGYSDYAFSDEYSASTRA